MLTQLEVGVFNAHNDGVIFKVNISIILFYYMGPGLQNYVCNSSAVTNTELLLGFGDKAFLAEVKIFRHSRLPTCFFVPSFFLPIPT